MEPHYHSGVRNVNTKVDHPGVAMPGMSETPKDRLKRLRKAAGMTQQVLADRAGVKQSTIGNVESGIRGYGSSVVEIARVLGVSPDFLLCKTDDEPTPPPSGVAHPTILGLNTVQPQSLTWEVLMQADDLPQEFAVRAPDGALGEKTPEGTILYLRRADALPAVGRGVLVEDAGGVRYIRRVAQGPGGAWIAQASAAGYVSLRSDVDGLKLLAVVYATVDESGNV